MQLADELAFLNIIRWRPFSRKGIGAIMVLKNEKATTSVVIMSEVIADKNCGRRLNIPLNNNATLLLLCILFSEWNTWALYDNRYYCYTNAREICHLWSHATVTLPRVQPCKLYLLSLRLVNQNISSFSWLAHILVPNITQNLRTLSVHDENARNLKTAF